MKLNPASPIVGELLKKRMMLERGDETHRAISTALICPGGNMAATFGAGALMGFCLAKMNHVFDNVVGVSAGSANASYLLSGQTVPGASIYYKQLVDRRFIDPWRFWKWVDLDYLEEIFRSSLDVEAVRASRSGLYFVSTTLNGKRLLLDAKRPGGDLVSSIKASMAIPILYNRPVYIEGECCFDGVASDCLPIRETLERFAPKNLLIVANHPWEDSRERATLVEKVLARIFLARYPKELRRSFLSRYQTYNAAMEYLRGTHGINVGVVSPDYSIPTTTKNPRVLREYTLHGAEKVWEVFGSRTLLRSDVLL